MSAAVDSEIGRAARGSTLTLMGAGLSAVTTFGLTFVVTHGLSRPDAGVFFATTSLFVIATSVGQLGTDTGLVYFIARAVEQGRRSLAHAYVVAALGPVEVCALVFALAMLVFAPELAALTTSSGHDEAARSLRALAPLIPFAGLEAVMLSATRGLGQMRPYVITEQILRPTLQLGVAFAIVVTGNRIDLAWSWSLPYALAGLLAYRWWRRLEGGRGAASPPATPELRREFWSFSAPRSLASAAQIAMQRVDIVLVAALAGPAPAAVYTAATRFVVAGQLARTAVSLAVQPHLARALAREGRVGVAPLYKLSTAWLMAVTWPLFWVLVIDGRSLMRLFGTGYTAGTTVLLLLGSAMLVATFCGDVDIMLVMAGRTRASMLNMLVALTVNIGLDVWLIPGHGILGAAIGWACAIVVKNLLALVQVAWVLHVYPVGRATGIVAALATGCFGLVVGSTRLVAGPGLASTGVGVVLASVLYAGGLYCARVGLGLDTLGGVLSKRRVVVPPAQMP